MAARTAELKCFYETGPFLQEVWAVTGTYVAGTDTLNAVLPQRIKIVKAVVGNFATYTATGLSHAFTFDSTVGKPNITFVGHGR